MGCCIIHCSSIEDITCLFQPNPSAPNRISGFYIGSFKCWNDRRAGGHVLDGKFVNPIADLDTLRSWEMVLPDRLAFAQAPLEQPD